MALHGGGGGNASVTYNKATSGTLHGGGGGTATPTNTGILSEFRTNAAKADAQVADWIGNTWSNITGTGQKAVDTVKDAGQSVFGTMLSALMSSAMEADQKATEEANKFNAEQAELNRIFQQESAQKAMDFEAEQAEINRTFQQTSAQKAMDFEAEWNQKAMDYNERMANTQYQRAVQDLKAAGLSPLLAYSNLSGSSPTISSISGQTASGSMASGRSASGSQASGTKASPSSAKQADLQALSSVLSVIEMGISAASSVAKIFAML